MNNIKNKIVLITGASSGIGEQTAIEFAKKGAKLILASRRIAILKSFASNLIKKYKTEVLTLELDVRKRKLVLDTIANLSSKWKNISILVNNAGLASGLDNIQDGNIDDWEKMIDTNLKGLLYVTRAILPGMVKRNVGHIINIGSIAGHFAYPKGNVYCATKFGVNALSQSMRMDLFGTPIRITSIDPGMVETEFSLVRFHGNSERAKKTYENTNPLTAKDVADAIIFSVSRPKHVNIQEVIIMPTDQASLNQVRRNR